MNDTHEVRELRRQLKAVHKQLGKQGQTIYNLRNEVVALQVSVCWKPGDRARMLQQLRASDEQNQRLREKLHAKGDES